MSATPDGQPLTLVFSDDFRALQTQSGRGGLWRAAFEDRARPDPYALPRHRGLEHYADWVAEPRDPFAAAQGTLKVTAVQASAEGRSAAGNYPYLSGLISTQPSFSQTYGYFEMRAELPQGKGLWPAFWLLPQDQSWPPEIDVVESIGDPSRVYMTAHSGVSRTVGIGARITPSVAHTFAVSWDPRDLVWYIDGVAVGRAVTPDDMHKPMFMLANLAIGGTSPGAVDGPSRTPAALTIDHIRAYRFAR